MISKIVGGVSNPKLLGKDKLLLMGPQIFFTYKKIYMLSESDR